MKNQKTKHFLTPKKYNVLIPIMFSILLSMIVFANDYSYKNNDKIDEIIQVNDNSDNFENQYNIYSSYNEVEFIYINGMADGIGAHNWTWAESQDWCNGTGTEIDPYVIDNISIDGSELEDINSIYIENSNASVRIINSYFFNSGPNSLKFENVNNTVIKNCTIVDTRTSAISYSNSYNNLVENNTIINQEYYGIVFRDSARCNATNNSIRSLKSTSYYEYGIYVYRSSEITISKNNILANTRGIYLSYADNITIYSNSINNSRSASIDIPYGNNITIIDNFIRNSSGTAIDLPDDDGYTKFDVIGNTINGCQRGIKVSSNITHSSFIGNNISYAIGYGMEIQGTIDLILHDNIIKDSKVGIQLDTSTSDTDIEGNQLINCGFVLSPYFLESEPSHDLDASNTVNGKPIYYYYKETSLVYSNFTQMGDPGQIILVNCSNSIIKNVSISNTTNAIQIYRSYGINIENNTLENNSQNGIIFSSYSPQNIVQKNIIQNNGENGIFGEGDDCHFYNNTLKNNGRMGIRVGADNLDIINNTITDNLEYGIFSIRPAFINISYNIISDNGIGICIDGDTGAVITYNNISDNNESGIIFEDGPLSWGGKDIPEYALIDHNRISNHPININLADIKHSIITFNIISDGEIGIYISSTCVNISLNSNELDNCTLEFEDLTNLLEYNFDLFNTINGKFIYVLKGFQESLVIDGTNIGQFILANCSDIFINNFESDKISQGIILYNCSNILLENISISEAKLGIFIFESKNISIIDATIKNINQTRDDYPNFDGIGIKMFSSFNISIYRANISNTEFDGIYIRNTDGIIVEDCNISNSKTNGIYSEFSDYYYFNGNNIQFNLGDGIKLTQSASSVEIINNAISFNGLFGIDVSSIVDNLIISNNNITNNCLESISYTSGLRIWSPSFGEITNNFIHNNDNYGIYVFEDYTFDLESKSLTISNNEISNNSQYGIYLDNQILTYITSNNIHDNGNGILCSKEHEWKAKLKTVINKNSIINNDNVGIQLQQVDNVSISWNNITNNDIGIEVDENSFNNTIHQNIFIDNQQHALDDGTLNIWYNQTDKTGNYWDDYVGDDIDEDLIGDTPYNIDGDANSLDLYPIFSQEYFLNNTIPINPGPVNPENPNPFFSGPIVWASAILGTAGLVGLIVFMMDKKKDNLVKNPIYMSNLSSQFGMNEVQNVSLENSLIKSNHLIDNYVKSNRSISEILEMSNFITTQISPNEMNKINQLKFSDVDKQMLISEYITLSPKERKKLLKGMK